MNNCYLDNRQQKMIASLVEGLKDGRTKTDWALILGDGGIRGIDQLDYNSTADMKEDWLHVSYDDINAFIDCGFMKYVDSQHVRVRLFKGKIMEYLENQADILSFLDKQHQNYLDDAVDHSDKKT